MLHCVERTLKIRPRPDCRHRVLEGGGMLEMQQLIKWLGHGYSTVCFSYTCSQHGRDCDMPRGGKWFGLTTMHWPTALLGSKGDRTGGSAGMIPSRQRTPSPHPTPATRWCKSSACPDEHAGGGSRGTGHPSPRFTSTSPTIKPPPLPYPCSTAGTMLCGSHLVYGATPSVLWDTYACVNTAHDATKAMKVMGTQLVTLSFVMAAVRQGRFGHRTHRAFNSGVAQQRRMFPSHEKRCWNAASPQKLVMRGGATADACVCQPRASRLATAGCLE
jgi:hypothetical protein